MQSRIALVTALLSLVLSILALSSLSGAATKAPQLATGNSASAVVWSDNACGTCFHQQNHGFAYVYNNGTGIYCLAAKSSAVNPNNKVPNLGVEYDASASGTLTVEWEQDGDNCDPGEFEVNTFNG